MPTLRPLLQLVRLPNLFTSAADSLAGFLLVGGALGDVARWIPLVAASVATYAGGIVLNDVCDHEVDLRERPGRPLPSGRVSRRFAAVLAGIGLIVGLVAAGLTGSIQSIVVETILIGAVIAYDTTGKRTSLGPFLMGSCRGLNLLLGMSLTSELGGPAGWLSALAYATFVAGITWISRSEVAPSEAQRLGRTFGVLLQNAAFVAYLAVSVHPEYLRPPANATIAQTVAGLLALLAVFVLVNQRSLRALGATDARVVQLAVKTGILSLVWLHGGLLLALRGPAPALAVAALWFPAVIAGRWLYAT